MNRLLTGALAVALSVMLLTGCSPSTTPGETGESTSTVGVPVVPTSVDQSTPEAAVRSYLNGISYAYRIGDSDVASQTMTPFEYVRVDSYIEKNRQEGKGIEQTLTALEVLGSAGVEPTITVSAREAWAYRYFSLQDGAYQSEELTAAYTTEYTVVLEGGVWKVDKVSATPQGEVK